MHIRLGRILTRHDTPGIPHGYRLSAYADGDTVAPTRDDPAALRAAAHLNFDGIPIPDAVKIRAVFLPAA